MNKNIGVKVIADNSYQGSSELSLREALSILSKASPYAVKTLDESHETSKYDIYKEYLYINTNIEEDVTSAVATARDDHIIFVCGSSGDGKSEILVRLYEKFNKRVIFHLDATHSFKPQQSAIETLDGVFSKYKQCGKPLVVGINIGMMGNFAEEGSEYHDDIKQSILNFLSLETVPDNHKFFNFEDYPKFVFDNGKTNALFAKKLLQLITHESPINPFFALYKNEKEKGGDDKIIANYHLMGMDGVQDVVIDEIFKARLIKDQFLTARSLLDFIHHLIVRDSYLFDSLFETGDSDLAQKISTFDPSTIRNKKIDSFVLQYGINVIDEELSSFLSYIRGFGIIDELEPKSLIRLFYILRKTDLENSFYKQFKKDFRVTSISKYSEAWMLHTNYEKSYKKEVRNFYNDILINAIHRYINRNAQLLNKGEYFIGQYNDFILSSQLEVKVDLNSIDKDNANNINYFVAYLKINGNPIPPIEISFNLFNLIQKINAGYRPNRHDKNVVIKLEEIAANMIDIAKKSSTLNVVSETTRWEIKNHIDDEEIEVREI